MNWLLTVQYSYQVLTPRLSRVHFRPIVTSTIRLLRYTAIPILCGCTDVFSRTGRLLFHTKSQLPGGGLGQSEHHNSSYCTMLDCILCPSNESKRNESSEEVLDLKVLDLIRFRTTGYTMLPFRERCDWLENYWREQIEANDHQDPVRFEVIRSHSCEMESMRRVLSEQPKFPLDGVLFYHTDVMYEPGPTPLVGWLKPYMIPEWFPQIRVHEAYLKDIPMEYTDYLNEIRQQETEKGNPSKCVPPDASVILPNS
ncbi:Snurportin-1 [Fasciola gigantica]|uniref:Snurportin-1 n=1 Tax=Fasciola gigantica TaxID=46835 RepID=A0A504YNI4_FASGI|nr:Snurportin-1 [Fasciola gigantica]